MSKYQNLLNDLKDNPKLWLITGVAGFIGSNILEHLLNINQRVVGLDNFSTGYKQNLEEVRENLDEKKWNNFKLITGDIQSFKDCQKACSGVDYVLHQAALGSVPRSINDPISSNASNIVGFLNMLVAARDENVSSFTYAASSSTYGDHQQLPKVENLIGKPLSPYAVTKLVNELYADVFARTYGFKAIGLRYFNVFGKRQNPNGPYAAVIPKWTYALLNNEQVNIYGDGETSRDFCFVENAVQANILASSACNEAKNQVYNVALGDRTSLNQLYEYLKGSLMLNNINSKSMLNYDNFRPGDVKHSEADISKAKNKLGYSPEYRIKEGIEIAVPWFIKNFKSKAGD